MNDLPPLVLCRDCGPARGSTQIIPEVFVASTRPSDDLVRLYRGLSVTRYFDTSVRSSADPERDAEAQAAIRAMYVLPTRQLTQRHLTVLRDRVARFIPGA